MDLFEKGRQGIDKLKRIREENKRAREHTPLPLVIINDGLPLFVIIAYLLMGLLVKPALWHPGWIIFFIIPIYYTAVESIKHKSAAAFPVPIIVVAAYLTLGCGFGMWHPYWAIFAIIPVYYTTIALVQTKSVEKLIDTLVPVVVVATYLLLGFLGNLWHPGWVVFFAIPLYYQIAASVKKYKRRKNSSGTVERHDDDEII